MKIAFLHYHTKKGGVTTVIGQQIQVLRDSHTCMIIKGEAGGIDFGVPAHVVPGLAYDNGSQKTADPEETVDDIILAAGKDLDVLHIHNPLLRKNSQLMTIIRLLKKRGIRLFLHIHDFAEDGRPDAYFSEDAYPDDVHYGVINKRDYRLLLDAGLRTDGLHYLPNMVSPLPYGEVNGEPDIVLYPVRGIRRKNLGEVLLLSLFLPGGLKLGITLPPGSSRDKEIFAIWRETAEALDLPVLFNLGLDEDFSRVLGRTRFVISTSIKEGFGFSFLEPWTIGKEVKGRYLDAVCPDFEEKGIQLPDMYHSFPVPCDLFDKTAFGQRWKTGVAQWAGSYNINIPKEDIDRNFTLRKINGSVDFGSLDEEAQREVIRKIQHDPEAKKSVMGLNGWLDSFFSAGTGNTEIIESNRQIILGAFGPDNYRKTLEKIYRKIQRHVPHGMEKKRVLDAFLNIDNYLPLGT